LNKASKSTGVESGPEKARVPPPPSSRSAPSRDSLRSEALRLLMPGVVHRLKNLCLLLSTRRQLSEFLDSEGGGNEGRPEDLLLLGRTLDRAESVLSLLKAVFSPSSGPSGIEDLTTCLHRFRDVCLLIADDHRYEVVVEGPPGLRCACGEGDFFLLLASVLADLLKGVPQPLPGRVRIESRQGREGPEVELGFEVSPGHLPLSFGLPEPPGRLVDFAYAKGIRLTNDGKVPRIRLRVPLFPGGAGRNP